MPIETITYNGIKYPAFQAKGGASLWVRAFAQEICSGVGLDIGYSKEKWMLPGAIGIEPAIDPHWDAVKLPGKEYDFIRSSHCLEHVKENWYTVLDYWIGLLKTGGVLFLYLPHKSQLYWKSISNRKHIHEFNGSEIQLYLMDRMDNVFLSGVDLNNSFIVIGEKR